MRDRLADRAGQRHLYIARLQVYGVRFLSAQAANLPCRRKRRGTALMKNVRDGDLCPQQGRFLTDHVWVPYAEPFVEASADRGYHVTFSASATPYVRAPGTEAEQLDYQLTDAQDVVILAQTSAEEMNARLHEN